MCFFPFFIPTSCLTHHLLRSHCHLLAYHLLGHHPDHSIITQGKARTQSAYIWFLTHMLSLSTMYLSSSLKTTCLPFHSFCLRFRAAPVLCGLPISEFKTHSLHHYHNICKFSASLDNSTAPTLVPFRGLWSPWGPVFQT